VVAIVGLHYRLVNIGIFANNLLAAYKVTFLGILCIAGFVVVCRDGTRHQLLGLDDYATTHGTVTPTNVVLALLLVFYSYDGWENASMFE
jgi:amino acid transporter